MVWLYDRSMELENEYVSSSSDEKTCKFLTYLFIAIKKKGLNFEVTAADFIGKIEEKRCY